MVVSSMSDRFRRAVEDDDLALAQRIYGRVCAQQGEAGPSTGTNGQTGASTLFDIRNQTITSGTEGGDPSTSSSGAFAAAAASSSYLHTRHPYDHRPIHSYDALGSCLALSASQFNTARKSRLREQHRDAVRAKSSMAIAVERGASIEMIQWLLEMGHERGDFSRDIRGCTVVSLAAQHNRTDVIEACCVDAVAHAATLHHQRSLMYYGFHGDMSAYYGEDDYLDEGEEQEVDRLDVGDPNDKLDTPNDGDLSPAMTLVTAAASTPSRKPSPNPIYMARMDELINRRMGNRTETEADGEQAPPKEGEEGDDASSLGGSSEMDDIVGVTVQRLLDCPDELGRTALSLASMKGHENVVRLLLDLGATVDLGDFEGNRPLHYASAYDQLIIVQILIERGCAYAAKNTLGFTPADYAFNGALKSAIEAFARAQFDVKHCFTRSKRRKELEMGQQVTL